jgi:hypothetical protein
LIGLGLSLVGLFGWGAESTKRIEPELVELPAGTLVERAST